jgi:DNA-binding ferritin-like protein (Dps family)
MKKFALLICALSFGISSLNGVSGIIPAHVRTAVDLGLAENTSETSNGLDMLHDEIGDFDRDLLAEVTENHAGTMEMYDSFVALLYKGYPNEIRGRDLQKILDAISFGAFAHKNQKRKNSLHAPYIIHPIAVAKSLWEEGHVRNVDVLVAAILHDTIEDTEASVGEIIDLFGPYVASIVMEVSDDKSLPKEKRKELQITTAPAKSPEAKVLKLADKLHNFRDLSTFPPENWPQERVDAYFVWGEKVIAGLRGSNSSLESALDKVITEQKTK